MKTRISLAVTATSFLFALSGGVVAQTPSPGFTTPYNFEGSPDGATPYNEALAIGSCGELYGTTSGGGVSGNGTVFVLTPPKTPGGSWTETVLHSFSGSDGSNPQSRVVVGPDGVRYGAMDGGGSLNFGAVFWLTPPRWPGCSWTEATLYSLTGATDRPIGPRRNGTLWRHRRIRQQSGRPGHGVLPHPAKKARRVLDRNHSVRFHRRQRWGHPLWRTRHR
jgi:uncharacterized repeat protein (TIGR03803 family)